MGYCKVIHQQVSGEFSFPRLRHLQLNPRVHEYFCCCCYSIKVNGAHILYNHILLWVERRWTAVDPKNVMPWQIARLLGKYITQPTNQISHQQGHRLLLAPPNSQSATDKLIFTQTSRQLLGGQSVRFCFLYVHSSWMTYWKKRTAEGGGRRKRKEVRRPPKRKLLFKHHVFCF